MAEAVNLELVSPERLLIGEAVEQVTIPGGEGDYTVLAGHAPVVSTVRPGTMTIYRHDGQVERIYVRGGFAQVTADALIVLAEEAIPLSELDRETLDQEIRNAEEDVSDAADDERRRRAKERFDHLRQLHIALDLPV
ncbi:MAG: F0F1 ATP synthase subunit epsilon [Hyphomicrobiales bacterium]